MFSYIPPAALDRGMSLHLHDFLPVTFKGKLGTETSLIQSLKSSVSISSRDDVNTSAEIIAVILIDGAVDAICSADRAVISLIFCDLLLEVVLRYRGVMVPALDPDPESDFQLSASLQFRVQIQIQ